MEDLGRRAEWANCRTFSAGDVLCHSAQKTSVLGATVMRSGPLAEAHKKSTQPHHSFLSRQSHLHLIQPSHLEPTSKSESFHLTLQSHSINPNGTHRSPRCCARRPPCLRCSYSRKHLWYWRLCTGRLECKGREFLYLARGAPVLHHCHRWCSRRTHRYGNRL